MKLHKRIEQIVTLTVDDLLSHGINFSCTAKKMIESVTAELMEIDLIEDYATAEVSLMVLGKLHSTHIIDFTFVMDTLLKEEVQK